MKIHLPGADLKPADQRRQPESGRLEPHKSGRSYGSTEAAHDHQQQVSVADIIGSFGWFQFLVLLFSGLREGLVGYDALVMSSILQPDDQFLCADKPQLGGRLQANASWTGARRPQCYQWLNGRPLSDERGEPIECRSWLFPHLGEGVSLIAEWSLVCHRHWLVAFIESAYFAGLVLGNLVWGYTADRVGRRRSYLAAHGIALLFGALSVAAPNIWLFTLCRFLAAFGSIGYNIIYSIQVELIGTRHRAFSTTLNHLGWGLGVILVPVADRLFSSHRPIVAVAPLLTLVMLPWALWLPESSRWLMANDRFAEARGELLRAAKFNGKPASPALDKQIAALERRLRAENAKLAALQEAGSTTGTFRRTYRLLLEKPVLVRDTILLSFTSFTGHLFYYVLTINFAYVKNLPIEANFIISGAGEWVSVLTGALLLRFCTRKCCMTIFLCLMASSFLFQSFIDSHLAPSLDTPTVVTLNNGLGTLSALLLVFIALIVNQEIYPTLIRQTGSSIVNTIGETGSMLAPLVIQFGLVIGHWRADLLYALVCTMAMIGVQFLSRTDDIELPDT